MTNDETRALAAAILRAVADYVEKDGGNLVGSLGDLIRTVTAPMPGDPAALIPRGQLDALARRKAAIEYVREKGRIRAGELGTLANCHPETARLCLRDLVKRGVLVRRGVKKATYYRAGDNFPRV